MLLKLGRSSLSKRYHLCESIFGVRLDAVENMNEMLYVTLDLAELSMIYSEIFIFHLYVRLNEFLPLKPTKHLRFSS